MPFTFAHPAAAVPLLRPLRRFGSLSALVIGSMSPDFAYMFPHWVGRPHSHSLLGLLTFCLPAGIAIYFLLHALIKQPVLSLLRSSTSSRLAAYAGAEALAPRAWPAVVVSLLIGAATHIVWDAFTHSDGHAVLALPLLQTHLFAVDTYHLYTFNLLQHVSSMGGMGLLAWGSWRWLRRAPDQPLTLALSFTTRQRRVVLAGLLGPPVLSLVLLMLPLAASPSMFMLQLLAKPAVLASIALFGVELLLFSLCWQGVALLRRSNAGPSGASK